MEDLLIVFFEPINLLFYLFAYGLAATPTSYLAVRIIQGVDIKTHKGHSHTASFLYKTISKSLGTLVFILDFLKGLIPCSIAVSLGLSIEVIAAIGFFAVLGHCFSIWLWFFGGHGGVTAAGSWLVLFWPAALLNLITNFILFILGFSAGVASVVGSLMGACVIFLGLANKAVLLVVAATVVLIVIRHWWRFSIARQTN